MERLTERDEFGNADIIGVDSEELQINLDFAELNRVTNALNKLAEYEDLEEQGKLLKLPCKPHDKLYWISDQEDDEFDFEPIEEVEVNIIDYNGYSLQLWFADKGEKEFPVLCASAIGKELFYSREEAEAALSELQR